MTAPQDAPAGPVQIISVDLPCGHRTTEAWLNYSGEPPGRAGRCQVIGCDSHGRNALALAVHGLATGANAPAGPVLGDDMRPGGKTYEVVARLLDRVAYEDLTPNGAVHDVLALLSSAREEGAAAERERVAAAREQGEQREWYAVAFDDRPEEQWLRTNSAERARAMARAHYGRAMVQRGYVGPWEPLDGPS